MWKLTTVKYSYPPKPLLGSGYLSSIPITKGEQLIISISTTPISAPIPSRITTPAPSIKATNEKLSAPSRLTPQPASQAPTPTPKPTTETNKPDSVELPGGNGFLELRVVPDDNSCLFSAIGVVFLGGIESAGDLRGVVVDAIRNDPETYSEVMLG
jgi:ubiquitin thioesterase OTU1